MDFLRILSRILGIFRLGDIWIPSARLNQLMDPSKWIIGPILPSGKNYSKNMPLHPSNIDGWSFHFPAHNGEVDYVTIPLNQPITGSALHIKFKIVGSGELVPSETPLAIPKLRLFIQRKGDDWTGKGKYNYYRAWSSNYVDISDSGEFTLTVPFEDSEWISVSGPSTGIRDILANCKQIGFTFGGNFAGHGMYSIGGPKTFILQEFNILK